MALYNLPTGRMAAYEQIIIVLSSTIEIQGGVL